VHRRYAFNHPNFKDVLGNIVEIDETFIGGEAKNIYRVILTSFLCDSILDHLIHKADLTSYFQPAGRGSEPVYE
jgi:hypothetical protein